MQEARNIPLGVYDIIILGGGPAGLTAGLYSSRARMNTLLLESLSVMSQAAMTETIENYPGVLKTGGIELLETFKKQAETFGLESKQATAKSISQKNKGDISLWQVEDDAGGVHEALSVIIATGASPKKLNIPGEEEFIGRGVSYCATCDAAFFRDKEVVVVGGGDAAVEEALFLTRFSSKVTLIHRRDRLRAAKILQERALSNNKMVFVWESVVEKIEGDNKVEKVTVRNIKTGKTEDISCDGVFIFVGWKPNTDFAKGAVEINEKGCIVVDGDMKTSALGVFAAGDCCKKLLHQVITACGDGATAAVSAEHHAERVKGTIYE